MIKEGMREEHNWHMFDAIKNMYTARLPEGYLIRYGDNGDVTHLTDHEFNALRAKGPNPKDLS